MRVLAFAASNNKQSINQKLAIYTSSLIDDAEIETLAIDDYELPIFSDEREELLGHPELAKKFFKKIGDADAIIISFAEHNGTYTAAYKNIFDWASRIDSEVFQNKPMVILSASPGPGGAKSVLKTATESAPYYGADVKASVSVPSFFDNFDLELASITNSSINAQLQEAVNRLIN